jgi:hypothetical protein
MLSHPESISNSGTEYRELVEEEFLLSLTYIHYDMIKDYSTEFVSNSGTEWRELGRS